MKTMTHTPEQREAWHAGKRTDKERRAEEQAAQKRLMAGRADIVRRIERSLSLGDYNHFQRLVRRLGRAAAEVALLESYARHLAAAR